MALHYIGCAKLPFDIGPKVFFRLCYNHFLDCSVGGGSTRKFPNGKGVPSGEFPLDAVCSEGGCHRYLPTSTKGAQ